MENDPLKELILEKEEKILLYIIQKNSENESYDYKLLNDNLDWYRVLQLTYDHGLPVQLYFFLKSYQETFPQDINHHLEAFLEYNKERNQIYTTELFKILNILKSNNVFALPYREVVLSNTINENSGFNIIDSLDFYIKKLDALKVKDLMKTEGYDHFSNTSLDDHSYLKTQNEYRFYNEKNNVFLNFRWNFSFHNSNFSVKDTYSEKKGLMNVLINNQSVWTFKPENHFLILCLHNAGHLWSQLKLICDLGEFITYYDLNWDEILSKSDKLGIKRILNINLILIHYLLGIKIHNYSFIFDQREKQLSMIIVSNHVFKKKNMIMMENLKTMIKIRENLLDGISDMFSHIFTPSLNDVNLPSTHPILSPFICVSRPLVLFKMYWDKKFNPKSRFGPSPPEVIEVMLKIAEVTEEDVVYDLGCGDGRIVIAAALDYSARGVGIDIDPKLIQKAKSNAQKKGVTELTQFYNADIKEFDISEASVVCLFLTSSSLDKYKNKLKKQLSPGTKIVSNEHEIKGWEPLKKEYVITTRLHPVYLWII